MVNTKEIKMVTAYVAEVSTDTGTKYLGMNFIHKGRTYWTDRPVFWTKRSAFIKRLTRYSANSAQIAIIQIDDLDKGLRASAAKLYSVHDFFNVARKAELNRLIPVGKNDVFKIRKCLDNGTFRMVGGGKYGKTWESAGALRSHISGQGSRDVLTTSYREAEVIQITMATDGFTVLNTQIHDLAAFYLDSPYSKKTYESRNKKS